MPRGVAKRTVRVRATKTGFYGELRRYEGDEFNVTLTGKEDIGSWMEEVKAAPEPEPEPDPEPDPE